jgi:hypothetical protein
LGIITISPKLETPKEKTPVDQVDLACCNIMNTYEHLHHLGCFLTCGGPYEERAVEYFAQGMDKSKKKPETHETHGTRISLGNTTGMAGDAIHIPCNR